MSRLVLTQNVREYRQTIPHHVSRQDAVLEVGCAWGTTSTILHRHAGLLVAIDKGMSLPAARTRHPQIRFERLDGFDMTAIRALGIAFTKVYLDISGCRRICDVIKLISAHESVFQPDTIVVKSSRLKRLVSRSEIWGEVR